MSSDTSSCPKNNSYNFTSVEDMIQAKPALFKKILTTYKIKNCKIKNGYCSIVSPTTSGCYENQPTTSNCSCDVLLFPLNLYNAMNDSIYCVLTDTSNTDFVKTKQSVVFSIQQQDGNIKNVNLGVDQEENISMVSLQSASTIKNMTSLSVKIIQDIIQQAKSNPSMFPGPINEEFINLLKTYSDENLNSMVNEKINSSVQLYVIDSQTISVTLTNDEFNSLQDNINQSEVIKILVENIVDSTLGSLTQSVFGKNFNNIILQIEDLCNNTPSTTPSAMISSKNNSIIENHSFLSKTFSFFSISLNVKDIIIICSGIFLLVFLTTATILIIKKYHENNKKRHQNRIKSKKLIT